MHAPPEQPNDPPEADLTPVPLDYATPIKPPPGRMPWWVLIGSTLAWLTLGGFAFLLVSGAVTVPALICPAAGLLLLVGFACVVEWMGAIDEDEFSLRVVGFIANAIAVFLGIDALLVLGLHNHPTLWEIGGRLAAAGWFGTIGVTHVAHARSIERR